MITIPWRLDSTDRIVREHIVRGRPVPPFALWLTRCLQAVTALQAQAPRELQHILVRKPIVLEAGATIHVEFFGKPEKDMGRFEVRQQEPGAEDLLHASPVLVEGLWRNGSGRERQISRSSTGTLWDHRRFYSAAAKAGFSYGPLLRRVKQVQTSGEAWSAELFPLEATLEPALASSTTWDALLQCGAILAAEGGDACWLPFRIDCIRFSEDQSGKSLDRLVGAWLSDTSKRAEERIANIYGFDPDHPSPRVEFLGVHYRRIEQFPFQTPAQPKPRETTTLEAGGAGAILGQLRASAPELRRPLLIRFIEDQLLEILRWDGSRRGELSHGFIAIGLDSLMSVDLQFRLQTALNFALPLGEGFESLAVEDLADALLEKYLKFN